MSNEQVTQHYIGIMQAYVAGEVIQYRERMSPQTPWGLASTPTWNFTNREYRIKPKSKPAVDWSALHPSIQWLARDSNGDIYGYRGKPFIESGALQPVWRCVGELSKRLDTIVASLTPGDCDWKDSLIVRPK